MTKEVYKQVMGHEMSADEFQRGSFLWSDIEALMIAFADQQTSSLQSKVEEQAKDYLNLQKRVIELNNENQSLNQKLTTSINTAEINWDIVQQKIKDLDTQRSENNLQIDYYKDQLRESREMAGKLAEALKQVNELCGAVSFSSHNQMKEAVQGSMELCESNLTEYLEANW